MAETRRRSVGRRAASETADSPQHRIPGSGTQEVSGDAVALRAYELYERRGGEHGQDWDDWFRAEQDIRERSEPLVSASTAGEPEKLRDR